MSDSDLTEFHCLWLRPPSRTEAFRHIAALTALLDDRMPKLMPFAVKAGDGDGEAAYRIGVKLIANFFLHEEDPVGRCWLWVAACLGSVRAHLAMAELVLLHAENVGPLFAQGFERRALDWFENAFTKFRTDETGGLPLLEPKPPKSGLSRLAETQPSEPPEAVVDEPQDDGVPRHRAITEIGAAKSGEGKAIAERWKRLTEPLPLLGGDVDPAWLEEQLIACMPWAADAARAVADDLRLVGLSGRPYFWCRPLLLVGAPGVGKTRWLTTLAELVGVPWALLNLGASADSRMLSGTARGWSSSQPMFPLVSMLSAEPCGNPLLILDEIDKTGTSKYVGNPLDALLAYLENSSAKCIWDECLLARADTSTVVWSASANAIDGLPDPLLSRFTVIRIGAPQPEHFDVLLEGLRADLASTLRLDDVRMLPYLGGGDVAWLRDVFARTRSVRKLKRAYQRLTALRGREEAGARGLPH